MEREDDKDKKVGKLSRFFGGNHFQRYRGAV